MTNKQLYTLCGVIYTCGAATAHSWLLGTCGLLFVVCALAEGDKQP